MPTLQKPRGTVAFREAATGERVQLDGEILSGFFAARDLLREGWARLRHFRDCLPSVKVELRLRGMRLQSELLSALEPNGMDDAATDALLANCGSWYFDVRYSDNGKVSDPEGAALDEVYAELDRYEQSEPNGRPPDPKWWARILRKLADAVKTGFGLQGERLDALEDRMMETFARIDEKLGRMEVDIADLKTGQAELRVDVSNLKTGQAELRVDVSNLKTGQAELRTDVSDLKAGQAELRADVSDLKTGQAELRSGQAELRADVSDLKTGQAELRSGQAELRADVSNLKTGQAELRSGQDELRVGQAELLEHARHGIGRDLQLLSHAWAANGFPRFWRGFMRGSPGAPHEHWIPRLKPSLALWHDLLDLDGWDAYRQALGLPESVSGADMTADLLTRFDYELATGEQHAFLLLGEVARQSDMGDVSRLLRRRNLLRDAGVDVPIVLCLFAQHEIESTRAQALMAEHDILHVFRGGRPDYQGWEADAQAKLPRCLGWDHPDTLLD